jgi:membrane carboxypeptidase/penicillin-binding protein
MIIRHYDDLLLVQHFPFLYLNKINLGNRSYGIATAAQKYYGKDLKDLQLHEVLTALFISSFVI